MIQFPLPSKNIRKENHVSQGSKSARLSHSFPYTSCLDFLFLNEMLVVEVMAKCWRNVRSEHLISSSQDTYRGFFQIEITSQGTHRCDMRPVLSKIRSMAIRRFRDLPPPLHLGGGRGTKGFKFQVRTADATSSIHLCCQNHQPNAPQLLTEKQLLCVELEMLSESNTEEPENQLIIQILVTS